jgi:hypothetical protein
MSQNRDAPAYQEYAASMLANLQFRLLPLEARGLRRPPIFSSNRLQSPGLTVTVFIANCLA